MRTRHPTNIEKVFTGVREVGETFADRIDEIHGMMTEPIRSLQRVPGKVPASTGLAAGPVWSLTQLRFRDSSFLLSHEGANLNTDRRLYSFGGRMFPYPTFIAGLAPLFTRMSYPPFTFDWPETIEVTEINDTVTPPVEVPQTIPVDDTADEIRRERIKYRTRTFTEGLEYELPENLIVNIVLTPTAYALDEIANSMSLPGELSMTYGRYPLGIIPVLVEWAEDWLLLFVGTQQYTSGDFIYTSTWAYLWPEQLEFRASKTNTPPGSSSATVTFTQYANTAPAVPQLDDQGRFITQVAAITGQTYFTVTTDLTSPFPTATRGQAFNLRSEMDYNNTYAPAGNVNFSADVGAVTIDPASTDNTGWIAGAKAESVRLYYGTGSQDVILTSTDPATGLTGSTSLTLVDSTMGFTITPSPSWVVRGVTFTAVVTASDNSYVPLATVDFTDDDPNDNFSPASTDNTGWASGVKNVLNADISGGAGTNTVSVTATDPATGATGSSDITVHDITEWPTTLRILFTSANPALFPAPQIVAQAVPFPLSEYGFVVYYKVVVRPAAPPLGIQIERSGGNWLVRSTNTLGGTWDIWRRSVGAADPLSMRGGYSWVSGNNYILKAGSVIVGLI